MLEIALGAFANFFITIDPVGVVPFLIALTARLTPAARRAAALKSVAIAEVILLVFTLIGQPLLHYLGITLPAFRIAGGVLLFLLAIPLIAGPGAIVSTILLQAQNAGDVAAQVLTAAVMLGVLAIAALCFFMAQPIMGILGLTGVNVLSRVLGIVLAALAIKNIIEGLRASFPILGA